MIVWEDQTDVWGNPIFRSCVKYQVSPTNLNGWQRYKMSMRAQRYAWESPPPPDPTLEGLRVSKKGVAIIYPSLPSRPILLAWVHSTAHQCLPSMLRWSRSSTSGTA